VKQRVIDILGDSTGKALDTCRVGYIFLILPLPVKKTGQKVSPPMVMMAPELGKKYFTPPQLLSLSRMLGVFGSHLF